MSVTYGFEPAGTSLDLAASAVRYGSVATQTSVDFNGTTVTVGSCAWGGDGGTEQLTGDGNANQSTAYIFVKIYIACENAGDGITRIAFQQDTSTRSFTGPTTSDLVPTGWSLSKSIRNLEITIDAGASRDEVLWVLWTGGSAINFINVSRDGPANIQAVAFATSAAPGNCLGPATMVETPSGSRRIDRLMCGDVVSVRGPDGIHASIPVDVVAFRRGMCLMGKKINEVVVSPDHLLLVPSEARAALLKPCEEWSCNKCKTKGNYGVDGCQHCAPISVPGYLPLLVKDIKEKAAEEVLLHEASWFHLVPAEEHFDKSVVLTSGLLSELCRTPVSVLLTQPEHAGMQLRREPLE